MGEVLVKCVHDVLIASKDLKVHPKNRNQHSSKQIERLSQIIEYQGIRHPVIVSKLSGYIVAGHGRLSALKKLKVKMIPVNYQDFESEEKEYAFLVSDNSIASWAELDLSGINTDIGDLGPDFNIDLLGIENFKIEVADKLDPGLEDDELPEHVEAKTKPGDLYQLGRHRLLCGSATELGDVDKLMGGKKVDMVWTDPPYNVAYEGKTKDALTIKNDEMGDAQFYQFLYDSYSNMLMHTKAGCAIYVAHADSEGANFRIAMTKAGWLLKQCLIWNKSSIVMGRQDYHWKHEPILYGWAPGASHNWYSDRKQSTVLEFQRPSRNAEHPTMKPLELIEYCLTNSCPNSGLVLDLFGGSGSTLIACEKTDRTAFLTELDPKYCDVIVARYEKYSGKKGELLNDEENRTDETNSQDGA